MKTISDKIRIGMVARETITQKLPDRYPISNDQLQIIHHPPKQQVCPYQVFHSTSVSFVW